MRSQWKRWPDEMRISWPVAGGTGHAIYQAFRGDTVEHDDGSWTPREFTYVEIPTDPALPYFVVECEHSDIDVVPRVMAVHTIQQDPRREVRASDFRRMRLEDALEEAWLRVTRKPARVTADGAAPSELLKDDADAPLDKRRTLRGLRSQNRRKITDELLDEVASVYRRNLDTGAPTKAVAERWGLAPSTASLYVKRARDAGRTMR
jgi:hypothetical protein